MDDDENEFDLGSQLDPLIELDRWCELTKEGAITKKEIPIFLQKEPEICLEQVIFWASRQATTKEIAGSMGVTEETLSLAIVKMLGITLAEFMRRCECRGKVSLRKMQLEHAQKSPQMAGGLGKQWLGQRENDAKENKPPNDENLRRLFSCIEKC